MNDTRPGNVLVLSPLDARREAGQTCASLLAGRDEDRTKVISVTLTEPLERRLAVWDRHAPARRPHALTVISAAADADPGATPELPDLDGGVTVERLSEGPGLTDIGVKVSQALTAPCEGADRLVLCFHSLTPLLQTGEDRQVYRFLTTLNGKVAEHGGDAHYHLNPAPHGERTVEGIKSLFSTVVTHDADGGREILGDTAPLRTN
jgi:hypothetical protein